MGEELDPSEDEMDLEPQDRESVKPPEAPKLLTEVEPIKKSRNANIKRRGDIKDLVEFPLVAACEELYDKNIKTLESDANRESVNLGQARLTIDFDSLSDANKEIARQLAEEYVSGDGIRVAAIKIPIDQDRPLVADIQAKAEEIARQFSKQRMRWANPVTLDQLKDWYGYKPEEEIDPEDFVRSEDYYCDEQSGLFYQSEEHYIKANEAIKE